MIYTKVGEQTPDTTFRSIRYLDMLTRNMQCLESVSTQKYKYIGRVGDNKFRSSDDVRMAQRRKVIQNMIPLAICKFPQRAPLASNISRKSHMISWCNWARLIKRLTNRGVCRIEMGTGCLLNTPS